MHSFRLIAACLAVASALSCSPAPMMMMTEPDSGAADGGAVIVDAGVDAGLPKPTVTWTPCPLHTEGNGPMAECATVPTPLDANNPSGPAIEVFVKRYRPAGGRGLRALWMLQGGPGASGYVFEGLSESFATRFPDVDYYLPDHRGTGRSTRLGCAAQEAMTSEGGLAITPTEWPACLAAVQAQYGTQLASFNTTNAANDLGVLINATRKPDQPVFVYGVSYGTYWAHRYVQLFPHQADGVVFDSVAPTGTSLARQDADSNEAAHDFMDVCGQDTFCSQKLGPQPWMKAERLIGRLKAGHCPDIKPADFETNVLFRRAFAGLLMDPNLRAYIAPIIYRADRCNAGDVAALQVLVGVLTREQPVSQDSKLWSTVLSNNILFSELFERPAPSAMELAMIRDAAVASRDITEQMQVHLQSWPVYTPGPEAQGWATSDVPMLFLQGGLDSATLLRKARVAKSHFTKPNQTWVEIPTASHTVIASSPYVNGTERRSCGTRLVMNFIESPRTPVDVSCVAGVLPIDFALVRPDVNRALFGTADAWE